MKRLAWTLLPLFVAAFAVSCSGDPPTNPVTDDAEHSIGTIQQATTFSAGTDSTVRSDELAGTGSNAGASARFCVGATAGLAVRRGVLAFGSVHSGFPASAIVQSATLTLSIQRVGAALPASTSFGVVRLTAGFTEGNKGTATDGAVCAGAAATAGEVTWANQPGTAGAAATDAITSGDTTAVFDVTAHVQNFLDTDASPGFMVVKTSEGVGGTVAFHSFNGVGTAPSLVVTLATNSPCANDGQCTSGNCVDLDDGGDCNGSGAGCRCCGSATCQAAPQCKGFSGCSAGTCEYNTNVGGSCNDGLFCTTTDTCSSGVCDGTGDPCSPLTTTDGDCSGSCNEGADDCTANDPSFTGCNDGTFCNGVDTCSGGNCSNHAGDPCLPLVTTNSDCTESCNEGTDNCTATDPDTTVCNDGKACTSSDQCTSGACGGTNTCTGCDTCEVGGCTTPASTCNISGTCYANGAPNPLNQCQECNTAVSTSAWTNRSGSCSDATACTHTDTCSGGACAGTAYSCLACETCNGAPGGCTVNGGSCSIAGTCYANGATNPSNVCQICNSAAPTVWSNNNGVGCNDANACTSTDTCSGGACAGTPFTCASCETCNGTGCTLNAGFCKISGTCRASGFDNPANECEECIPATSTTDWSDKTTGSSCGSSSNTSCDNPDTCTAGVCLQNFEASGFACGSSSNTVCDNPDTCNGAGACLSNFESSSFVCLAQQCTNLPPPTVFSQETCDGAGTCPTPSQTPCAGGIACNPGGTACLGACGSDLDCPSNKFCDVGTGNCLDDLGPGVACARNAQCSGSTTSGTCVDLVCCLQSSCNDGVSCTVDTCTAGTGVCNQAPNAATCSDGLFCTGSETCHVTLDCQAGVPPNCNDGVGCTDDSCNEAGDTCVNAVNNGNCNDGVFCNGQESCSATLDCQTGPVPNCSDGIACTVDFCNASTDACSNQPSAALCGDGNVCTGDFCIPGTGCANPPLANGAPCPNATLCDGSETCQAGTCTPGTPPSCNDGQECTNDSCSAAVGCVNAPKANGVACADDGLSCTTDACQAGSCSHPPIASGTECRAPAGVCDVAEACPGSAAGCPADAFSPATTECRAADCVAGVETLQALCPGSGPNCPLLQQGACPPYACDPAASQCFDSCASDAECAVDNFCNGSTCVAELPKGQPCGAGTECASGFCVDGVCCMSQCTGQCEACDVTGTLGDCSPVFGAPHGSRPVCAGDGTGCDGLCDGVNAATCFLPSGTECRAGTCTGGVATLQASCDGTGTCPPEQTQDCGPFTCGPVACNGDCTVDAQCAAGFYCSGGVCTPDVANGQACGASTQCASGYCVDDVCCDAPCDGQCEACTLTGTIGTCSPVSGAPVGGRPACTTDGTNCAGVCDGLDREACAYPASGVVCRPATCVNDIATLETFCSGTGTCPGPHQQQCPGACVGTTCGECTADSECALGEHCAGGTCKPTLPNGTSCGGSSQCTSGACVDGFCCASACLGQCEACDVAGSEGSCTPVVGSPHGVRPLCTGDGSACDGQCDGVEASGCAYPGATVVCRAGSCVGGLATLEAACQGDGACPAPQLQQCGAGGCDVTTCNGDCTLDTDCVAGSWCSAGVCVPGMPNGDACSGDGQCASGICIDGVCCDQACTDQCQACDVPGQEGTCSLVVGGPHGGRDQCVGFGPCGGACLGAIANACSLPDATTPCGAPACAGSVQTAIALCSGGGTCLPPEVSTCAPLVCGPTSCLTACVTNADCQPGLDCVGGQCALPMDAGADAAEGGADGAPDGTVGDAGDDGATPDAGDAGDDGPTPDAGADASVDSGADSGPTTDAAAEGGDGAAGTTAGHIAGDDGGCGCRVQGASSPNASGVLAMLAMFGVGVRRRGRGPRIAPRR